MKHKTISVVFALLLLLQISACKKEEGPTFTGTWALDKLYDANGKKLNLSFEEDITFYPCQSTQCSGSVKTSYSSYPYYGTQYADIVYTADDNTTLTINSIPFTIEEFTVSKLVIYRNSTPKAKRHYNKLK